MKKPDVILVVLILAFILVVAVLIYFNTGGRANASATGEAVASGEAPYDYGRMNFEMTGEMVWRDPFELNSGMGDEELR